MHLVRFMCNIRLFLQYNYNSFPTPDIFTLRYSVRNMATSIFGACSEPTLSNSSVRSAIVQTVEVLVVRCITSQFFTLSSSCTISLLANTKDYFLGQGLEPVTDKLSSSDSWS